MMSTYSCPGRSQCATPRCAFWRLAVAAAALLAATVSEAEAARYEQWEPTLTDAQARSGRVEVGKILRNATSVGAGEKKILDTYFKVYFFPVMTFTDSDSLGNLAKSRKELFQQYINFAQSQAVRDYLIDLSIKSSGKIAFGDFHPAARYNAVLIIGGLDAKSERNKPPVVSPDATRALLILTKNDEYKGNPIPSSVKVAALIGLQRHARFGVEDQFAKDLTDAALAIINRQETPEDVTTSVYNWMRVQAAEVLAYQYAGGPTPEVTTALAALLSDEKVKLPERCRTALLLEKMKLAADGSDAAVLAPALKRLADAILAEEREAAEEYQEEMLEESGFSAGMGGGGFGGEFGGGGGYGRGGGYGGGGEFGGRGGYGGGDFGAVEETGPRYERRRMLNRIISLAVGMKKVEDAAADDVKQKLSDILNSLQGLAKSASDKSVTDLDVASNVIETAKLVAGQAADWAAPPAEEPADEPAEQPAEQPADMAALEDDAVTQ